MFVVLSIVERHGSYRLFYLGDDLFCHGSCSGFRYDRSSSGLLFYGRGGSRFFYHSSRLFYHGSRLFYHVSRLILNNGSDNGFFCHSCRLILYDRGDNGLLFLHSLFLLLNGSVLLVLEVSKLDTVVEHHGLEL
jgi:hypothetical protein